MQKTKDRAKILKGQKVKQRSTKHYAENKRSSKDTKGAKGQTTIYKALYRKQKIEQHEPH
jgi:hypothetical protein